jgi:hypothetical protein
MFDQVMILGDRLQRCPFLTNARTMQAKGYIGETRILSLGCNGITYRHYAHRAPLAFKAIMTLPQPMAFTSLAKGFDGECPCCRRTFSGPDS